MDAIKESAVTVDGVTAPVECIEMRKGADEPDLYAHFHDYVELLYLLDGEMKVWLNGKEHDFKTGELLIINSNESHRIESVAPISEYDVIKFNPEILYAANGSGKETRYIMPFLSSTSTHPRVYPADFVSSAGLPELIKDAVEEWNGKRIGYELCLRGDVLKMFGRIVAYLDGLGVEIRYSAGSGSLYGVMSDIIDYINRNFASCDERELAKKYDVSYSYFSRTFKHIMNMSFKEYVNYLRINEAQRLLITTNKSISEISSAMGFSSPSHFINVFRIQMGRAPKQYRKALSTFADEPDKKTKSTVGNE